jgi:hypothetical protein
LYSSPHCTPHLVCPLFSTPFHGSNRSAIFVHRATLLTWILYLCASILTGNVTFTFLVVLLIGSSCELVGFFLTSCHLNSSFNGCWSTFFVLHNM